MIISSDKLIKVELDDYILLDKLNSLSIEYATSVDWLINISVRRLVNDVDFFRELRKSVDSR